MVQEEADIEETEATWEDDTQTKTNVLDSSVWKSFNFLHIVFILCYKI